MIVVNGHSGEVVVTRERDRIYYQPALSPAHAAAVWRSPVTGKWTAWRGLNRQKGQALEQTRSAGIAFRLAREAVGL